MTRARGVPRLSLWTNLRCLGGVGLPIGMDVDADTWNVTESEEGPESMVFTMPRWSDAGSYVAEGQVASVWRSDTDYDEWDVTGLKIRQGDDAMVTVTCSPLIYRLTRIGLVDDWEVNAADGRPALDWGMAAATTREIFVGKVLNNPRLARSLAWLTLGDIDPEDTLIDIDVSWATPRQVLDAELAALAKKSQYCWLAPLVFDNTLNKYKLPITTQEQL